LPVELDPGGASGDPTAPAPPTAAGTYGGTYEFLGGEPTIQVLSPDIVRDAQRITARAQQSGVVYSLLFAPWPRADTGEIVWSTAAIQQQLAYWAGVWNANAATPGVVAIALSQQVDPAGELKDVALVTIQSSSGRSFTQLLLYPHDFFHDTFPGQVAIAREQLDAAEVAV
jgi:hypothetical protein